VAAEKKPIASVWTRPRKQREQPALSREQIVVQAVQLLDAEGLEALSMRRLGAAMNAGATSLYRHVANKDELIELVVDEAYGELEVTVPTGPKGWRKGADRSARSLRAMVLRHPWIATVLGQVGLVHLGPNAMSIAERLTELYQQAGFPPGETDLAAGAVTSYVIGMATNEAAYLSMIARSGQTEQEWMRSLQPSLEQAAEAHPHLREGQIAVQDADPEQIRNARFDYGLARVLDGLESRLGGPKERNT
jgi:AcrR family transcriptional regulator